MNKNAIQKYAVWARNELIDQVQQRAYQYGISDKGYGDEKAAVIGGHVLSADEQRQRHEFVLQIKENGFQQTVEEVAYTWFNRFVALRFMEVNDYLPTHMRVFSDASGGFNPEILKDVLHLDLPGLDKVKVSELLNANQTEELYRYLLLTQCNALNAALPEMFEKLGSYTEMLLPNSILKPESVIGRLVRDIPEDDWRDTVQIIGWMYQYYNTEPKRAVFDGLKKNVKITKEKIPAATQLFTPDWIVRYMVENSLGRLWLESHPNDALKANWKYYLDEVEQTPEVAEELRVLRSQSPVKSLENIRLIDPCMGSGHILVYAFDVLMQIYESEGYNPRDAAKLILEKNIYGLDIDRRAYQLAYFSLMMKARQYNRRIFSENIKPQVYHPAGFPDGEEYGSLVKVDALPPKPVEKTGQLNLEDTNYALQLNAWNFKRLLAQKYDVVVTNPPYMGGSGMNAKMSEFVKENYPDSKSDTFSAFIERGLEWIRPTGYNCMVTMQSWMFLSSFETMRKKVLSTRTITNLLLMENMVMGIAFGTAVTNLYGRHVSDYKGQYNYMTMKDIEEEKPINFPTANKRNCTANADNFAKIPGSPVAFWLRSISMFEFDTVSSNFVSGGRNKTHNNEKYVRCWWEILDRTRFLPYANGGDFRKWYGNYIDCVDWSVDATVFYDQHGGLLNEKYWNKEGITWGAITSNSNAFRFKEREFIYSSASPTIFNRSFTCDYALLGFLNSKVTQFIIRLSNPTLNLNPNDILSLPYSSGNDKKAVEKIVLQNISLSRTDWNAFEASWDFKKHPLI